MDSFMDKLAQRFTAQEMIKANSAAETEELNRLREQVKEYRSCLDRLEEICRRVEEAADAALVKINSATVDSSGLNQLMETANRKVEQIEQDEELLDSLRRQLVEMRMQQCTADHINGVNTGIQDTQQKIQDTQQQLQDMGQQLQSMQQGIQGVRQGLQDMSQQDNVGGFLEEKLENVNDNVHKECVKVYRNVQAVITEEGAKQTEGVADSLKGLGGKLKGIFGISVAALIFSLAGLAFQVLTWLHII